MKQHHLSGQPIEVRFRLETHLEKKTIKTDHKRPPCTNKCQAAKRQRLLDQLSTRIPEIRNGGRGRKARPPLVTAQRISAPSKGLDGVDHLSCIASNDNGSWYQILEIQLPVSPTTYEFLALAPVPIIRGHADWSAKARIKI